MAMISLVIVLTFVLIACASQSQAAAPVAEITVWDISETSAYVAWWRNYVEEFNKNNPNVKVTWENFSAEGWKQKIEAALIAGTQPDIFYTIPGDIAFKHYAEGKMLAIEDLYDISPYTDAGVLESSYDGKMICHPIYISISSFYYHKEQFAKAGIDPQKWNNPMQPTWDEFINACEKLKAAGFIPIAMGNKDKWPFLIYVWGTQNRYGGREELFDAVSGAGSYTDPGFLKAAELAQLLALNGYFPKGFNGIGGDEKYNLLTQGNGAMLNHGPWVLGKIKESAPEGFEFGMFKFPIFPDRDPGNQDDVTTGIDGLWVSSTTKYPDVCAKFLQGLTTIDSAVSFMKETDFLPTIKGIREKARTEGVDPAVLTLLQYSDEAKHGYPWWDWALPGPVAEGMINMSQPLSLGEITPQEFVDRLEAIARPK